jgi:hypothetical protein
VVVGFAVPSKDDAGVQFAFVQALSYFCVIAHRDFLFRVIGGS